MSKITDTAQAVLEKRYFLEGESTWWQLCERVSQHFGKCDKEKQELYSTMFNLDFLPNSPAMMNAGTAIEAYSACYVLPVEDSIESIFKYYSDAGLISKSGGGVGANFSNIRSSGSIVNSTDGVASGPLSFMAGQDALTEVIKQGGRRRGANMGILMCDHEDILDFVKVKDNSKLLTNFNLSVGITDDFMDDVINWETSDCTCEEDESIVFNAHSLWDELVQRAWSNAEPGVLFMDTIADANPVPHLGRLEATNPCGEQPLLPYESCTLGSLNLSNMVRTPVPETMLAARILMQAGTKEVDWAKLRETIRTGVLFLNRILDKSKMPIPECQEAMEKTRKIGLGIMGLHDMLIQLGLPYDSEEGRVVAGKVMKFIAKEADVFSKELGDREGYYGGLKEVLDDTGEPCACYVPKRRNACLTTIAPTGTLSMIADCSSGCEPYYAPVTIKEVLDGTKFTMANKWFLKHAKSVSLDMGGILTGMLDEVAKVGIMNVSGVKQEAKELFKGANDIHWSDHVKMQAVLQEHVDSSISKTINMSNDATVEDVKGAYELAYTLGCKGITVYRDGSREAQVLSTSSEGGGDTRREPYRPLSTDTVGGDRCPTGDAREACGNDSTIIDSFEDWPVPYKVELPDQLTAKRYRVRDHEGNKVYFTVCTMDGKPVEVFARLSEEKQDSYWHTICRLTSCLLRFGVPLDDVTKQLRKSSSSVADTPSKLARILDGYKEVYTLEDAAESLRVAVDKEVLEDLEKSLRDKSTIMYDTAPRSSGKVSLNCPECDAVLIHTGGCVQCNLCGWEKCS